LLLFVGEYRPDDAHSAAEFAVADVIVELANDPAPTRDGRTIRVAKLRGSSFIAGQHPFVITNHGIQVHQRLESNAPSPTGAQTGRAAFTHDELNAMTGGGMPRGDVALLLGPTGTGKTTLALQWVHAGLVRGERALYVALEENPDELSEKADAFGLDFTGATDTGHLRIIHAPAGLTDPRRAGPQDPTGPPGPPAPCCRGGRHQ